MIVVSGESLLDVFAGAESGNGMALDAVVVGSPLNVAMGLARLGRPVMFFGAVLRAPAQQQRLRAPVPGADMHAKAAQWLHVGVRVVAEFAVQATTTTCTRQGELAGV